MKPTQNVLTVRHAHGGQVDLIPIDDVYTVRLIENLKKDPLHTTFSQVQVKCLGKTGEVKFTYCQFRQPECFDFICQTFGIETALEPEKRDGFRALREQSWKERQAQEEARRQQAENIKEILLGPTESSFPPGLIPKFRYWLANAQG